MGLNIYSNFYGVVFSPEVNPAYKLLLRVATG